MELNVERTYALGFDVYGTLVEPLALAEPLQALVGEQAVRFAELGGPNSWNIHFGAV
jgi:hypothetical protein